MKRLFTVTITELESVVEDVSFGAEKLARTAKFDGEAWVYENCSYDSAAQAAGDIIEEFMS